MTDSDRTNLPCQAVSTLIEVGARPAHAYYPAVDGSHAYIDAQLARDARTMIAAQYAEDGAGFARASGGTPSLVADARTQADIAAGRLPSYQIVLQQRDGRCSVLATTDGKPFRFRADPHIASQGEVR